MTKAFFFAIARKLGYLVAAMAFTFLVSYFNTAEADTVATPVYRPIFFADQFPIQDFTSVQSICDYTLNYWNTKGVAAAKPYTLVAIISGTTCQIKPANNVNPVNYGTTKHKYCGGTLLNWTDAPSGMCAGSCGADEILNTTTNECEDKCKPLTGTKNEFTHTSGNLIVYCIDGCGSDSQAAICGDLATTGKCHHVASYTGKSCTVPVPTTVPPSAESECIKKGDSYGLVNGVAVCVPKGTAGSAPITEAIKSPTTTTTAAPTATNPNPTPVITTTGGNTTTTVNGSPTGTGSGTVTQSTTNPDGSTTTTESDKTQFCELNPNAEACKGSDDLCAENPDIPACKAWCDKPENEDKIACQEIGEDLTPDEIGEGDPMDFGVSPVSGIPSMAGCPSPDTVSIGGRSIPISYDAICMYASAFKFLVLIFSWLGAAYIVSAAVNAD